MSLRPTKPLGDVVLDGQFKIPDLGPNFVRQVDLERRTIDIVPLEEPPIREQPLPLGTYVQGEAAAFNHILTYAPADTIDVAVNAGVAGSETVQAAAWSCIYLWELVNEAKRPGNWIASAKTKLRELADWLVDAQYEGPFDKFFGDTDPRWGAYERTESGGSAFYSEDSAAAGLALLRAYQVLGGSKYIEVARACAWFLRSAQCGDLTSSTPSSTNSAGTAKKHWGMWSHRLFHVGGSVYYDHCYYPGDLIGAEFLKAYQSIVGDETISSSSNGSYFTASRAASVSTAIAEARAFWEDGAYDVGEATTIKGFSTATPREFFNSYPASKGFASPTGTGSWDYQDASDTKITTHGWAVGARAFRALDGDSSFVTGVYDWLMTFTDNADYNLPAEYDKNQLYSTTDGTYDPTRAVATLLNVTGDDEGTNGSSILDLAATGLLAPLASARQAAGFRDIKDTIDRPRPRYMEGGWRDGQELALTTMGRCGLSYQPYTSEALARLKSTTYAAQTALMYRHAPNANGVRAQ